MEKESTNINTPLWRGKIACQYVHSNLRLDTTQVKTSVNSYIYTLFEKGTAVIKFDKYEITAHPGDFLIFPPHIYPNVLSTSDDYEAICLIVNSSFVYDCPMSRSIFQASAFSLIHDDNPLIKLTPNSAANLRQTMLLIMHHIQHVHKYTQEVLQSLYGLLLSDLMPMIDKHSEKRNVNPNAFHIFIEFNKLLRIHFREHHDISFYAELLKISSRYLSMVTKQISQLTVASLINRHLMLEACWLLKTTDYSIQRISEILHFADQASFSKFFKRLNGKNPLHYRHDNESDLS